MKQLRIFGYYIAEAFKGLARNALMSATSAVTVAACSFMIILSYCAAANIDYLLLQLERGVGVSVIIDDDLEGSKIQALYDEIAQIPHVTAVEYVSSKQALIDFAEELGEEELLAGFENDNPLPRSFTLTIDGVGSQKAVIAAISEPRFKKLGVSKTRDAGDITEILTLINRGVRIASLTIIILLTALAAVIIANSVKLAVNARRHEINIMKYVGATDWFIKWPFVLEGGIVGLFGALATCFACFFGYDALLSMIASRFPALETIMKFRSAWELFTPLTVFTALFGAVIGVCASLTSMRKYLNV